MAQDNTIPLGKPGIASFESETYGNVGEYRYSDTPPEATVDKPVTSAGAIDWPFLTAVNVAANGAITKAVVASGASNMTHLLATPIVMGAGQTMSVPLIAAGHFAMQAVTFDASFTTDALKTGGSALAPMLLISKRKYDDANYPV